MFITLFLKKMLQQDQTQEDNILDIDMDAGQEERLNNSGDAGSPKQKKTFKEVQESDLDVINLSNEGEEAVPSVDLNTLLMFLNQDFRFLFEKIWKYDIDFNHKQFMSFAVLWSFSDA